MLNIKTTKENIIHFMKYMIIFAIIACLYNIVKNWTLILNLINITSSYQVDLKSFFPNRNQFGMFLFIAIVANNYRTLVSKKNSAYYMVNFLLIMNLMMTMSRGAILALLIFYIILYIQQLKSKKTLISLIIILSTVITVIFSNSQLRDFIVRNVVRADAGVAGRLDVWKMGVNVYSKSNLLSGVGFHTGIDIAKAAGFRFDQFHNFFIDILVSGGLIELMFMVITILYVYRRVMIKCWDRNYKRIYKASMGAIIALGLVESVSFFSIGFVDTIYTIFFITIPILASSMMPPKDLGVAGVEINDNLKGGQNEEKYDRV
jgi:O-antigen ligase